MGVGAGADEEEEEEEVVAVVADGGGGEEQDQEDEVGGDAVEGEKKAAGTLVLCSICLEPVVAGSEERSSARLQCGHKFHLDCIGSAFNAKGIMQCPNCRKIETGNWLYANGSHSSQDANNDEWVPDEDLYDVGHSEMATFVPLRVQWCPIGRIAQIPSLFDEVEPSSQSTFHDFMGQNFNAEPVAVTVPGTTHPGPYLAYFQPLPPPSASSSSHVAERTIDNTTYHDQWNALAGPSDGRPLQAVHPIDFHHNSWVQMPHSYSQLNNNNTVPEQPGLPVGAMRIGGVDSDSQQRGSLPSFYGSGSGRQRIPSVPAMEPQFIRAHSNMNEEFQHGSSSFFAGSQRSGGTQPLGAVGAAVPPPGNTNFSLFPPAPSGSSPLETEDDGGNQFYAWERDRFAPYPLVPVNNEGIWWNSSQQQPPESSSSSRRLFGQWIGAGRSPSENRPADDNSPFRPMHIPRM